MKIFTFLLLLFTFSFAKVYYSKVQPYEIRDISSNVSGLVLFTDEDMIGKKLGDKAYIIIDDELDKKELQYVQEKLGFLKNMIKINEDVLKNLEKSLEKKQDNYEKIIALRTKSVIEKDKEFYDLVNTQNQLLSTQKEVQNLKVQMADLKLKEAYLLRSINDKNLKAKDFVLYSILVKPGKVVGISTPLAQIADTSKALLTIYLDEDDLLNAKEKTVYINGKKTEYKISRVLNIADSKNISKYMAQIIVKAPKIFSKLAKVELKDE